MQLYSLHRLICMFHVNLIQNGPTVPSSTDRTGLNGQDFEGVDDET